jgi:hypothetical protein
VPHGSTRIPTPSAIRSWYSVLKMKALLAFGGFGLIGYTVYLGVSLYELGGEARYSIGLVLVGLFQSVPFFALIQVLDTLDDMSGRSRRSPDRDKADEELDDSIEAKARRIVYP